jgi:sec-independent protein translocase protein TatA
VTSSSVVFANSKYISDQIGGDIVGQKARGYGGITVDTFSIWHWIVVVIFVLLLFGRGKVSDLMADVAHGIRAFRKTISEDEKQADSRPRPSPGQPIAAANQVNVDH